MIKKHASLVATLLMALAPVGAPVPDKPQQPAAPPQTASAESPLVPGPSKKPFTNIIFVSPRAKLNISQPTLGASQLQPAVVCGMTLIPGNPAIDPKIVAQPRVPKPIVDYKIRSLTPSVCGQ